MVALVFEFSSLAGRADSVLCPTGDHVLASDSANGVLARMDP